MYRTQRPLKLVASVGAFVLASAAFLSGMAMPAIAAASGVETIDFEDGSTGSWIQNDAVTLTVIDGEGDHGGKVLEVSDRTAIHFGLQSPAGVFAAGVGYLFSADVFLPASAAEVRFIAFDEGTDSTYNWVGSTTVEAGQWTTVTGSFTFSGAGIKTAKAYIEVANTEDYLVDNVVVSAVEPEPACEAGAATVANVDFDSSTGGWSARGAQSVSVTDDSRTGAGALAIGGRSASWNGASLDVTEVLTEGTYQITAYAKLGAKVEGTATVNLGMNEPGADNEYPWVGGQVTTDSATWVEIGGSYTVKPHERPAVLYLESSSLTADLVLDDVVITHEVTCDEGPEPGTVALSTSFEDGLDGWELRNPGLESDASVDVTTDAAHTGDKSAVIQGRASQGHGLRFDVTDTLVPDATYELSAWVRFASDAPTDDIWLSFEHRTGDSTDYPTIKQFSGMSNSEWVHVTAQFRMPSADQSYLYFQTAWIAQGDPANTSTFYVDDISVTVPEPPVVQDITPLKDTLSMPMGVAIDSSETSGPGAEMVTKHFDQVTPENHMKPEAWYEGQEFSPSDQIDTLMDFAKVNDLNLYGHVLVWHSQTPDWFFKDGERWLTSEAADQQILRMRMRTHIFNVAEYLSAEKWGKFGGGNPVNAFDVVNEVIDDSAAYDDGMRRSYWYQILGEDFVDLAFQYADEAFNGTYAAESAERPVTLFINDYNTEQSGKRGRYLDLVDRLIDRGAPIDGVGHQFHLSLSTPVQNLEAALSDGEQTGLIQAVTELDVTTGVPESQAKFIDQGYYYRDAFEIFRAHQDDLFSVTVWGLTDQRSWRDSSGGPLVFDDDFSAKPAYYGIVEGESDESALPDRLRTANVFAGSVDVDDDATTSATWKQLPLERIDDKSQFQLRWAPEYLTVYVQVADNTATARDGIEVQVGDSNYSAGRDGSSDVDAAVVEDSAGYTVVARVPFESTVGEGATVQFDVRVVDGEATTGWNSTGVLGTLTLAEPISYLEVPSATQLPVIDGVQDAVWDDASQVTSAKVTSGDPQATGTFSTLWSGNTLYVHAHIADDAVDVTGSDPWTQDSVEIYVDAGNVKNGSYRYDDSQIRINANNVQSFGAGDEGFQQARVESATLRVDGGYVVEAAISLLEYGGIDTFHGVDFQVNDAADGSRIGIRNWADPTGMGYQSTSHWGVATLVGEESDGGSGTDGGDGAGIDGGNGTDGDSEPADGDGGGAGGRQESDLTDANRGDVTVPSNAVPGETITVGFGDGHDGKLLSIWMFSTPQLIASVTVVDGEAMVTVPLDIELGEHRIVVYDAQGELLGWDDISIVAASDADGLSSTGANVIWAVLIAFMLVGLGGGLILSRRQKMRLTSPLM